MGISTHILDTSRGKPAEGVAVALYGERDGHWLELAHGITNADGRVKPLLETVPSAGLFRISFQVAPYFAKLGQETFFPAVNIDFHVKVPTEHFHVPLLLNPFGYSTYRGS